MLFYFSEKQTYRVLEWLAHMLTCYFISVRSRRTGCWSAWDSCMAWAWCWTRTRTWWTSIQTWTTGRPRVIWFWFRSPYKSLLEFGKHQFKGRVDEIFLNTVFGYLHFSHGRTVLLTFADYSEIYEFSIDSALSGTALRQAECWPGHHSVKIRFF